MDRPRRGAYLDIDDRHFDLESLVSVSAPGGFLAGLRVCVDVDDVERAVDFYTRGLGLEVGRRFGAEWVELIGGPVPIDLLGRPAGTPANPTPAAPARDYRRHWTPVHLDFVVDDLDAARERAIARGAAEEGEVRSFSWGRIARLADPFGHGLCLLEFRGRGYDEILQSDR